MTINLYHVIFKQRIKKEVHGMAKLVLFFNSFLSYLLLVVVFVLAAGIAVFIGIKLRKARNTKEKLMKDTEERGKTGTTNEV